MGFIMTGVNLLLLKNSEDPIKARIDTIRDHYHSPKGVEYVDSELVNIINFLVDHQGNEDDTLALEQAIVKLTEARDWIEKTFPTIEVSSGNDHNS